VIRKSALIAVLAVTPVSASAQPSALPPPPAVDSRQHTCTQPPPFVVFFEWERFDLTQANRDTILAALSRVRNAGCKIHLVSITGHTDSAGGNRELISLKRAEAVKEVFVSLGAPPHMVEAIGLADTEPAEPRPQGTREPLNRRAEVDIYVYSR